MFEKAILSIAKNSSNSEFIEMLTVLENYEGHTFTNNRTANNQELVSYVQGIFSNDNIQVSTNAREMLKVECNCDWTCEDGSPLETTDCEKTARGCGFLWLGSCEVYN